MQKFHGTKVLGTFAPEERKFHRSESSMERKFGLFAPRERMFHGSESSLYGLFAPGNESAEERKGQLPDRRASGSGADTCFTVCIFCTSDFTTLCKFKNTTDLHITCHKHHHCARKITTKADLPLLQQQ